jgi:hypothetical protein
MISRRDAASGWAHAVTGSLLGIVFVTAGVLAAAQQHGGQHAEEHATC